MSEARSSLEEAVAASVDRLTRPVKRRQHWLMVACILIAALLGVQGYYIVQQHDLAVAQQKDSIAACQIGNQTKEKSKAVIDDLLSTTVADDQGFLKLPAFVALENDINALPAGQDQDVWQAFINLQKSTVASNGAEQQAVTAFEAVVAKAYEPQNCSKEYGK